MTFIKHEQAWGRDGKEGPSLFAYLKGVTRANDDSSCDVIATVVSGGDILKRHQADTAAELDALLPAVLDRAFRGWL